MGRILFLFLFPFFITFSAENDVIKYKQPKEVVLKLRKNVRNNEFEKERLDLYAREYINHNYFIAKPDGAITCDKEYCYIKYKIKGKYNEPTAFFDKNYHEVAEFKSKPNEDILGDKIENGKTIDLGLYYNKLKSELQKKAGGNVKIQIIGGLVGTDLIVVRDNGKSNNRNATQTQNQKPKEIGYSASDIPPKPTTSDISNTNNIQSANTGNYNTSSNPLTQVFGLFILSSLFFAVALTIK